MSAIDSELPPTSASANWVGGNTSTEGDWLLAAYCLDPTAIAIPTIIPSSTGTAGARWLIHVEPQASMNL